MSKPNPDGTTLSGLDFEAFLYATNQMSGPQQDAFERRMGYDEEAREALSRTMQSVLTLSGGETPLPDTGYREAVKRQLGLSRPAPLRYAWKALSGSYSYRGHPIFWVLVGGVVTLLFLLGTGNPTDGDGDAGDGERIADTLPLVRQGADEDAVTVSVPDDPPGNEAEVNAVDTRARVADGGRRRPHREEETDTDSKAHEPMTPAP